MFSRDRLRPHQALQAAVLRHVGDAEIARLPRRCDAHRLAVEQDLARRRRRDAEDGERQLGAARCRPDRRCPRISPARSEKRDVAHAPAMASVAQLEHGVADRALRSCGNRLSIDRPTIIETSVLLVDLADVLGADMGAVAQHGDAVGEREDLRQAVADIDDGDAALRAAGARSSSAAARRPRPARRSARP